MIIEISMAEILKIGTEGSFWKLGNRDLRGIGWLGFWERFKLCNQS